MWCSDIPAAQPALMMLSVGWQWVPRPLIRSQQGLGLQFFVCLHPMLWAGWKAALPAHGLAQCCHSDVAESPTWSQHAFRSEAFGCPAFRSEALAYPHLGERRWDLSSFVVLLQFIPRWCWAGSQLRAGSGWAHAWPYAANTCWPGEMSTLGQRSGTVGKLRWDLEIIPTPLCVTKQCVTKRMKYFQQAVSTRARSEMVSEGTPLIVLIMSIPAKNQGQVLHSTNVKRIVQGPLVSCVSSSCIPDTVPGSGSSSRACSEAKVAKTGVAEGRTWGCCSLRCQLQRI